MITNYEKSLWAVFPSISRIVKKFPFFWLYVKKVLGAHFPIEILFLKNIL